MKFINAQRKLLLIGLFLLVELGLMFPNPLLGSFGASLTITMVSIIIAAILLLPRGIDYVFSLMMTIFTSVYFAFQTVYFRAFSLYGLSKTLWSFRQDITAFSSSIKEFITPSELKYFLLPLIFLIMSFGLNLFFGKRKIKDSKRFSTVIGVLFIGIALINYFSFQNSINKTKTDDPFLNRKSDYTLYQSASNVNVFVERYGLIALAYRDASSYLLNPYPASVMLEDEITTLLLSKTQPESNDYSGTLKGKNVILIEAESLNNLVIDPVLTPTLYRLKTQGIYVEGYNSPLLTGSTSDTEFMVNTSQLPAFDGKIAFNDYADNTYPQTLAKVLSSNGYYSIAAHNNYGEYYNRTNMLPTLGYTFFDAIGLQAYDNVDDSYVIDHIKWMIYGVNPSLAFWVTFNAHQPYDEGTLTPSMKKYLPIIEKRFPDLTTSEIVYFAKNMDLDAGLSKLLLDYKNAGVLNDLVLVVNGEHYPKGLFQEPEKYQAYCELNGLSLDTCYQTPLIIFNTNLQAQTIKKTSSPLDIAPTLYDLLGVQYDARLTLGNSLFDPNYTGFDFNAWDMLFTDNYIYDPLQDTVSVRVEGDQLSYLEEAHRLYYAYDVLKNIVPLNYFESESYKKGFGLIVKN